MFTSLIHAATISLPRFLSLWSMVPSMDGKGGLGNQIAAGIEKRAHHIPLKPIASRRAKVEPFSLVTGIKATMRRQIPAPYPRAIPIEDIRDVSVASTV